MQSARLYSILTKTGMCRQILVKLPCIIFRENPFMLIGRCDKVNEHILQFLVVNMSWSSSVSVVSDHRLDDRGSIPGRGKVLTLCLCVKIFPKAHPQSYAIEGTLTQVKSGRGVTLTTHPNLMPRQRMNRIITPLPLTLSCAILLLHFTGRERLKKNDIQIDSQSFTCVNT
jgi:hypothetical protein